jgi:4-hydroxy-tetrahydrodipicolinate reductase
MGRRIIELIEEADDLELGGAFDRPEAAGAQIGALTIDKDAATALQNSDVLIDFTEAHASLANVAAAAAAGKAAVVGTTGLSEDDTAKLRACAGQVAIVFAPNMSVGVNLLFKLTAQVASVLGLDYNVEITEVHHNQKKDSPSGTAVRLAEKAAEGLGLNYPADAAFGREGLIGARPKREIGVHALRGGDVVGDHTVAFIGQGERIELTHRAHNRDTFARGALAAARFVAKATPGLYDMQDVLGLR